MNMRWYLLRRIAWTIFGAYLLLTGAFFLFAYTPDPNEDLIAFAAGYGAENPVQAQEEALAAYREARNYDRPVLDRYRDWMVGYATFNWGWSYSRGEPVVDLILDRLPVTLAYLVPAVVLATLTGIGLGLAAALDRHGVVDVLVTSLSYLGVGLPAFFLGEALIAIAIRELGWYGALWDPRYGLWTVQNLSSLALPAIVVAANLLAVQVRYARAEALEFLPEDFVRRLHASGASTLDVARHVLRNAAFPLVSLLFTEMLAVLFVTIYVLEVVFEVPGVGMLAYDAIHQRDIGLILATTLIPAFVGLLGNLIQDVAYTVLDPRVDYDERG